MKITKRQAWYLASFWAFVAGMAVYAATGSIWWGVAANAALLSVACAVQFDPGT